MLWSMASIVTYWAELYRIGCWVLNIGCKRLWKFLMCDFRSQKEEVRKRIVTFLCTKWNRLHLTKLNQQMYVILIQLVVWASKWTRKQVIHYTFRQEFAFQQIKVTSIFFAMYKYQRHIHGLMTWGQVLASFFQFSGYHSYLLKSYLEIQ